MRKPILKHLMFLAGGIIAGLVIVEICMRIASDPYPFIYEYDPNTAVRFRANAGTQHTIEGNALVQINSHGFRGPEPAVATNSFRIALLGDSFTVALEVENHLTFCSIIADELDAEVLNFGMSGFSTAQSLLLLKHDVWSFNPDMIILAIYPGNDIRNNSYDLEPQRNRPFYDCGMNLSKPFLNPWFQFKARMIWPLVTHVRLLQTAERAEHLLRAKAAGTFRDTRSYPW
jgi:hypothetical protein